MALTSITLYEVRNNKVRQSITEYIICSSDGTCSLSLPDLQLSLGFGSDVTTVMTACLPLVILLLSINLQTCKKLEHLFTKCCEGKYQSKDTRKEKGDGCHYSL